MTQWATGYLLVYKAKDWIIFENKNIMAIADLVQPILIICVVIASFWFPIIMLEHYSEVKTASETICDPKYRSHHLVSTVILSHPCKCSSNNLRLYEDVHHVMVRKVPQDWSHFSHPVVVFLSLEQNWIWKVAVNWSWETLSEF